MSTHNLKGFCVFNDLINNNDNTTSAIGALSSESRTQSRNVQVYSASPTSYSDFALNVFSYKDASGNRLTTPLASTILDSLYPILDWVNEGSRDGTIGTDVVQFNSDINIAFGSDDVTLSASQMFSASINGGTIIVPIKLTIVNTALDYTLVVWFVDSRFKLEYDDYEYEIRFPTSTVDILAGSLESVTADIGDWDTETYNQEIAALANGDPYTKVVTTKLEWHQLDDNRLTKVIEFTTIIWGNYGDNIEYIRNNLVDRILELSGRPESDWIVILPDLFIKDEFTIVPRWDKIAIGEVQTMAEIYSPIYTFADLTNYYDKFPTYSTEHVNQYLECVPMLWQSMGCLICGGTRNNILGSLFSETYGDLILARAGSLDYDRMSDDTRELMGVVDVLVVEALNFTGDGNDTLPDGVVTVIRNGLVYLQAVINDVTLLMLTRVSYTGELVA